MNSVPVAHSLVALFMYMMQATSNAAVYIIATLHDVVQLYLQIYVHTFNVTSCFYS
jgi:hypothetical protein